MGSLMEEALIESSARDIYLKIKQRSMELGLPCNAGDQIVGFGKFDNFYMYWINIKDGEFMFTARKHYAKCKSSDNIIRLPFTDNNENAILNSIEDIYKSLIAVTNSIAAIKTPSAATDSALETNAVQHHTEAFESETDVCEKELSAVLALLPECIEHNADKPIGFIFDTRVRNLFAKRRIASYGDILQYTAHDIREWKNCGIKCLEYITNLIRGFLRENKIDIPSLDSVGVRVSVDEQRLQKIIAETAWQNYSLSSAEMEEFAHAAVNIKQLFEQAENVLNNDYSNKQHWSILTEYIYDDSATLQIIGNRYGITRERVRQIVKKYTVRIKNGLRKKSSVAELSSQIVQTFDAIDDALFIHFIAYGLLVNFGKRFTELILSSFYADSKSAIDIANSLLNSKRRASQKKAKKSENTNKEATLLAKACYPSGSVSNIDISTVTSVAADMQFQYKENVTNKILQFQTVKRVIVNPDLVYSQSSKTNHVPDFLIETSDGKIILVVVVAVINMAIWYNTKRFNDLHIYCKANGFGYIIMNENFKTIFDVKRTELSDELVNDLNYILDKSGSLVWKDIVLLRDKHAITNDMIVAYVLQNKLDFRLKPFVIKKRGA